MRTPKAVREHMAKLGRRSWKSRKAKDPNAGTKLSKRGLRKRWAKII